MERTEKIMAMNEKENRRDQLHAVMGKKCSRRLIKDATQHDLLVRGVFIVVWQLSDPLEPVVEDRRHFKELNLANSV